MFALNEKVVYPGHGVALISRIIERVVAGEVAHFYELKFLNKDMTILIPIDNLETIGIRGLSTKDYIESVFKIVMTPIVKSPLVELNNSSWNKRNKKYQSCLRSGNLVEISKIYRDLHYLSLEKELSFGERNLLSQTELLLAEEISMVEQVVRDVAIEQLRSCFSPRVSSVVKGAEHTL